MDEGTGEYPLNIVRHIRTIQIPVKDLDQTEYV